MKIGLAAVVVLSACSSNIDRKLDALSLTEDARQALGRMRWTNLREGDKVSDGDAVLCGPGDRVLLAFSRRLMSNYLGIDAEYLLPELFENVGETEVFLEVPELQFVRLFIPPGIGSEVPHPQARVREASGNPNWSGDLRAIDLLFEDRQIFARSPTVSPEAPTEPSIPNPRRIGITPFPRMGPRSGVVIERILTGGAAAEAGLKTGDKIVAVNSSKVGDIRDLKRLLQESRGSVVVLRVKRSRTKLEELVEIRFD